MFPEECSGVGAAIASGRKKIDNNSILRRGWYLVGS
jgi:hypothetical protein